MPINFPSAKGHKIPYDIRLLFVFVSSQIITNFVPFVRPLAEPEGVVAIEVKMLSKCWAWLHRHEFGLCLHAYNNYVIHATEYVCDTCGFRLSSTSNVKTMSAFMNHWTINEIHEMQCCFICFSVSIYTKLCVDTRQRNELCSPTAIIHLVSKCVQVCVFCRRFVIHLPCTNQSHSTCESSMVHLPSL